MRWESHNFLVILRFFFRQSTNYNRYINVMVGSSVKSVLFWLQSSIHCGHGNFVPDCGRWQLCFIAVFQLNAVCVLCRLGTSNYLWCKRFTTLHIKLIWNIDGKLNHRRLSFMSLNILNAGRSFLYRWQVCPVCIRTSSISDTSVLTWAVIHLLIIIHMS